MTNPTQPLTLIQHPADAAWKATVDRFWRPRPTHARHGLTESEHVVIEHFAQGQSVKEVAFALGVTQGTVYKHLHTIRRVLRVHSIPEVIRVYFAAHSEELDALRGDDEREVA